MKPSNILRPLSAALCGLVIAALPQPTIAQDRPREERSRDERARDERPTEGQRPPRGDFKPDERPRGEARPPETRREEPRRDDLRRDQAPRGEARPADRERSEGRPVEGQRGGFNPQEMFQNLNESQRSTLRGFFEINQDITRETTDKMMRLRREIAESALADKPNEALIREKAMEVAKLEADATIARARAFARVRDQLPKETNERLRMMVTGAGFRPGFQPSPQSGPDVRREGGDVRRPGGDNAEQPGRRPAEADFRRPAGPRDGDQVRRPGEGDRGPRPDGDRGPRPDGDRGPRPDGDRGLKPDGERGRKPVEDRRPETPRRPPADQ